MSSTAAVPTKTYSLDSHSDSESHFDSVMGSHPNSHAESESESDLHPDPERSSPFPRPSVPRTDPATVSAHAAPTELLGPKGENMSMDIDMETSNRNHSGDQDHAQGLSTLANVARLMSRRDVRAAAAIEKSSPIQDDLTTASESEG
ncbi:hypothetical protein BGW38_008581, partial [Lunasporangiospora selenospora]